MPQPALPAHLLALAWRAMVVCFGHVSSRFRCPTERELQWEPQGQECWMRRESWKQKWHEAGAALFFSLAFLKQENKSNLVGSHFSWTRGGEKLVQPSARGSKPLWGSLDQVLLCTTTHGQERLCQRRQDFTPRNPITQTSTHSSLTGLMLVKCLFASCVFQCNCSTCCITCRLCKPLLRVCGSSSLNLSCDTEFVCYHSQNPDAQFIPLRWPSRYLMRFPSQITAHRKHVFGWQGLAEAGDA